MILKEEKIKNKIKIKNKKEERVEVRKSEEEDVVATTNHNDQ